MLSRLDRLAYRSQHLSFLINATMMQEAARIVSRARRPHVSPSEMRALRERRIALHRTDLANVEAGMYPRELLFDIPVRRYLRELPRARARCAERRASHARGRLQGHSRHRSRALPAVLQAHVSLADRRLLQRLLRRGLRARRRAVVPRHRRRDAPTDHPADHATHRGQDGGCACSTSDAAPAVRCTRSRARSRACACTAPICRRRISARARKRLADVDEVTLAVENAEALPWADATFDVATSVYMFHELPRNARRKVVREMLRVVQARRARRDRGFGAARREAAARVRVA